MNSKILIILFPIILIFVGCRSNEKSLTCKEYASDINTTFLSTTLSPIQKGAPYILAKGSGYIEPIVSGDEITIEIITIDLDLNGVSDCLKVTQDLNDTNLAKIVIN